MGKDKGGVWEIDDKKLERQHRTARQRGRKLAATELRARSVHYDTVAGDLVVDLHSGVTILISTALLQGLGDASPQELAQVELGPRGASVHWKALDVDFGLTELIAGVFGTRAWMAEIERRNEIGAPEIAQMAN